MCSARRSVVNTLLNRSVLWEILYTGSAKTVGPVQNCVRIPQGLIEQAATCASLQICENENFLPGHTRSVNQQSE